MPSSTAPASPAGRQPRTGRARWPLRLVVLAMIWGLSFLFIKIGDEALAPLQVALGRMLCGTAALLIVMVLGRHRLPTGWRTWAHLAVASVLLNAAPFTLFAYGEQHVSSVLAGIWNATTPLTTMPVAMLLLPAEQPTRDRVAGLLVGFAGAVVVLGAWSGLGGRGLSGNLLCLAGAACYGAGFPYTRRYLSNTGRSPISLATGQLLCGTAVLAIVTPLFTTAPATLPIRVIASIVALGALGTGIAYVLNYSIIRDAGATVASTVTYLIPVFSTLAGVVVLGERLSWNEPVGGSDHSGRRRAHPGPAEARRRDIENTAASAMKPIET
ncbi:MAG: DMT family transporter [Acidimicrobiales bacterium]